MSLCTVPAYSMQLTCAFFVSKSPHRGSAMQVRARRSPVGHLSLSIARMSRGGHPSLRIAWRPRDGPSSLSIARISHDGCSPMSIIRRSCDGHSFIAPKSRYGYSSLSIARRFCDGHSHHRAIAQLHTIAPSYKSTRPGGMCGAIEKHKTTPRDLSQ